MELREKLSKTLEGIPTLKKHESEIRNILKTSSDIKNAIRKELDFLDEKSPRSKMEEIRAYNMLSFMYNIYGDEKNTVKYIDLALQIDPSNIITLTCKAYFFLDNEERLMEVKDIIHEINAAIGNEFRVIQAHAEIACAFSRLGMNLYSKAISHFESVIEKASYITAVANEPLEWKANICIWTFGLALTKRRQLHTFNMFHLKGMTENLKTQYRTVAYLLQDVIKLPLTSDPSINEVMKLYRARAMAELGQLVDSVKRNKSLFPRGVGDIIPDCDSNTSARTFINQAHTLCNDDAFVLQKCGKFYRYNKEIDLSIDLLQRAVCIKPTSFGLHHLALSLKRRLEMESQHLYHGRGHGRGRNVRQLHNEHTREQEVYTARHWRREPEIQRGESLDCGNYASGFGSLSCSHNQNERRTQRQSQNRDTQQLEAQMTKLRLTTNETCPSPEAHFLSSVSFPENIANETANKPNRFPKHTSNERYNLSYDRQGRGGRVHPPFRRHVSELPASNSSLENMIKSPKKVIYINTNNSEAINTVLRYLDKAIEMTNTPALYDKGLFFRQIKDPGQAYDIFKKVIKDEQCSRFYLANSYEQAAYCILDMQLNENDDSKEFDMKYYLKRSVEVSCNIVAKIPFLTNCWQAAPTLLDFLKRKAKTTETLQDIGFLYDKMENYEDAIDVYKELLDTIINTGELKKKIEIITNLIKTYIHTKRYDDAVLAFDTIMCLPDGRAYIDADLYVDVHIEGGLQSLIKGECVMAHLRLKNALQFNSNTNEGSEDTEETMNDENDDIGRKFDIYILCEEEAEEQFMNLMYNLKSLGLSVTLNAVDVPPGQTTMEGTSFAMEASDHFVIALEAKQTRTFKHWVATIDQILQKRNNGNMVILAPSNYKLPTFLYGSTVINSDVVFEKDADIKRILSNSSLRSKLKDIISTLSRKREAS